MAFCNVVGGKFSHVTNQL